MNDHHYYHLLKLMTRRVGHSSTIAKLKDENVYFYVDCRGHAKHLHREHGIPINQIIINGQIDEIVDMEPKPIIFEKEALISLIKRADSTPTSLLNEIQCQYKTILSKDIEIQRLKTDLKHPLKYWVKNLFSKKNKGEL